MAILASLPTHHHNLFSSLPSTPPPNNTNSKPSSSPPIPIPKYPPPKPKPLKQKPQISHPSFTKIPHNRTKYYKPISSNGKKIIPISHNHQKEEENRAIIIGELGVKQKPQLSHPSFTKIPHNRTKYYKPISSNGQKIIPISHNHQKEEEENRAIIIGESGVSYLLPGAPFEFQFSYSETPKAKPLAIREPAYLPFAPPSMPRPWTGKAPLKSKKEKELKKNRNKISLFDSFDPPNSGLEGVKRMEMLRGFKPGEFGEERSRDEVLGEPLSRAEIKALVKPLLSDNRQVNLGRDGLTHNMLELIHSHWKRQQVCKVKCKGVPTVDMDNVCKCLEERVGGKIIHRAGGVVYLFRGRNYDYRTRPRYPIMLWKPAAPVYPKLIQDAPGGLTKQEADDLRRKGKKLLAICKLAKNGVYISLVNDVRHAFEGSELVKIDCKGLDASDYKKIGAKLMELVPCVLLSFDDEQILLWRGFDWKSMYSDAAMPLLPASDATAYRLDDSGESDDDSDASNPNKGSISPRMMSLWKRALDTNKALLLNETDLGPDALLEKVEEFQSMTQAMEHSYPAMLISDGDRTTAQNKVSRDDEEFKNMFGDDESDEFEEYESDPLEEAESLGPPGSLPVDHIARRLLSY